MEKRYLQCKASIQLDEKRFAVKTPPPKAVLGRIHVDCSYSCDKGLGRRCEKGRILKVTLFPHDKLGFLDPTIDTEGYLQAEVRGTSRINERIVSISVTKGGKVSGNAKIVFPVYVLTNSHYDGKAIVRVEECFLTREGECKNIATGETKFIVLEKPGNLQVELDAETYYVGDNVTPTAIIEPGYTGKMILRANLDGQLLQEEEIDVKQYELVEYRLKTFKASKPSTLKVTIRDPQTHLEEEASTRVDVIEEARTEIKSVIVQGKPVLGDETVLKVTLQNRSKTTKAKPKINVRAYSSEATITAELEPSSTKTIDTTIQVLDLDTAGTVEIEEEGIRKTRNITLPKPGGVDVVVFGPNFPVEIVHAVQYSSTVTITNRSRVPLDFNLDIIESRNINVKLEKQKISLQPDSTIDVNINVEAVSPGDAKLLLKIIGLYRGRVVYEEEKGQTFIVKPRFEVSIVKPEEEHEYFLPGEQVRFKLKITSRLPTKEHAEFIISTPVETTRFDAELRPGDNDYVTAPLRMAPGESEDEAPLTVIVQDSKYVQKHVSSFPLRKPYIEVEAWDTTVYGGVPSKLKINIRNPHHRHVKAHLKIVTPGDPISASPTYKTLDIPPRSSIGTEVELVGHKPGAYDLKIEAYGSYAGYESGTSVIVVKTSIERPVDIEYPETVIHHLPLPRTDRLLRERYSKEPLYIRVANKTDETLIVSLKPSVEGNIELAEDTVEITIPPLGEALTSLITMAPFSSEAGDVGSIEWLLEVRSYQEDIGTTKVRTVRSHYVPIYTMGATKKCFYPHIKIGDAKTDDAPVSVYEVLVPYPKAGEVLKERICGTPTRLTEVYLDLYSNASRLAAKASKELGLWGTLALANIAWANAEDASTYKDSIVYRVGDIVGVPQAVLRILISRRLQLGTDEAEEILRHSPPPKPAPPLYTVKQRKGVSSGDEKYEMMVSLAGVRGTVTGDEIIRKIIVESRNADPSASLLTVSALLSGLISESDVPVDYVLTSKLDDVDKAIILAAGGWSTLYAPNRLNTLTNILKKASALESPHPKLVYAASLVTAYLVSRSMPGNVNPDALSQLAKLERNVLIRALTGGE